MPFMGSPCGSIILDFREDDSVPPKSRCRYGQEGDAAVVLDDTEHEALLEVVLEEYLAADGVNHPGIEDAFRLALEAQDAGMDDFHRKFMLPVLIMDVDRVGVPDQRRVVGQEIEPAHGDILDLEFHAVEKLPGHLLGQLKIPENGRIRIETLKISFPRFSPSKNFLFFSFHDCLQWGCAP